jgi:hypothetical protein
MTYKLACLCPTFKRPDCLSNAVACFQSQIYPEDSCKLFILDDANQYGVGDWDFDNIHMVSTSFREPSLPHKFNKLSTMAQKWKPDAFVIWEDDDVFLPWHLLSIDSALGRGGEYLVSQNVWSNYGEPRGRIHQEGAAGRFHSSWAFTTDLFNSIGGYPTTSRLDFDQQLGSSLRKTGSTEFYSFEGGPSPSYVYRWGISTYNGSQQGEEGYQELWDKLGSSPAPFVEKLVPKMDRETEEIYRSEVCDGRTV